MSVETYLSSRREKIEQMLTTLLDRSDHDLESLFEAARYSLLGGGKRLRPLLVLAVAESFGATSASALQPACAVELLHTYSLIHDDLPCMDDDDFRRGKPSLHKVYEEGHAVLTGDFLLTYAFEILAKAPHLSSDQRIDLIELLSRYSGSNGMLGGQVLDIAHENKPIDWPILEQVHRRKTAALITACFEFGAVIADVEENQRVLLRKIGDKLGFAFQIVDDIIDAGEEGPSAVSLLGLESAREYLHSLQKDIHGMISELSEPCPIITYLAEKMIDRNE